MRPLCTCVSVCCQDCGRIVEHGQCLWLESSIQKETHAEGGSCRLGRDHGLGLEGPPISALDLYL